MKHTAVLALLAASVTASAFAIPAMADHHAGGEKMANKHHSYNGLKEVLAHERRAKDAPRDKFRNPGKTIKFFDIQPNHTVAEYAAGGGWYTRVLAPYVAAKGKYIAINPDPEKRSMSEERKARALAWAGAFPARVAEWTGMPAAKFSALTSGSVDDTNAGTVDRIIMPRMMHNLYRGNIADNELKSLHKLLKDDGMIGIVQHRAKDDTPFSYANGNRGYLRTATVVKLMESHGFKLVKKSEINANSKDTADYAKGVWTLPPRLAEGDKDKAKYQAIGESDRMTLLFKKVK